MAIIENKGVASASTAMRFYGEMRRIGISSGEAGRIWRHERAHFNADPKKTGEFGYKAVVEMSNEMIVTSYLAYYKPTGGRTWEDMMSIASAPGFDMSIGDRNIYNASWRSWVGSMNYERHRFSNKPGDEKGKIPQLIAIPKRSDEDDEQYKDRSEIVKKFAEKLKKFEEQGRIPKLTGILSKDFSEIEQGSWAVIKRAYEEALIQVEFEKKSNKTPENKDNDINNQFPNRRKLPKLII